MNLENSFCLKVYLQFLVSVLFDYFCQTTKSILQCPNQREQILKTADRLLDKMNFPNSFKDLEAPKIMFWKN